MEYRAEKSTDTLIADYANYSMFVSQEWLRRTALRLNALSCIVKQGEVFIVKSVIFTFVELLHRRAQCSKFFIPPQEKKKKLQISFARVCHNSLRDGENKSAGVFNYLCKCGIGGTEIDSQF